MKKLLFSFLFLLVSQAHHLKASDNWRLKASDELRYILHEGKLIRVRYSPRSNQQGRQLPSLLRLQRGEGQVSRIPKRKTLRGEVFVCKCCDRRFSSKQSLGRHKGWCYEGEEKEPSTHGSRRRKQRNAEEALPTAEASSTTTEASSATASEQASSASEVVEEAGIGLSSQQEKKRSAAQADLKEQEKQREAVQGLKALSSFGVAKKMRHETSSRSRVSSAAQVQAAQIQPDQAYSNGMQQSLSLRIVHIASSGPFEEDGSSFKQLEYGYEFRINSVSEYPEYIPVAQRYHYRSIPQLLGFDQSGQPQPIYAESCSSYTPWVAF